MRTFIDLLGLVVIILGTLLAAAGWFFAGVIRGGDKPFWIGVIMIVVGWLMSSVASKKTCPQCAEQVKHKALKCKYCGHEFGASVVPTAKAS